MTLLYKTSFDEGLPQDWHAFGGDKFDASQVSVSDGILSVYAGPELMQGAAVNMESDVFGRVYGEWQVCLRLDKGLDTRGVALLWPIRGGTWPPEVDFFEIGGEDAGRLSAGHNVHYKDAAGKHKITHRDSFIDGDFSEWHVIGCIWRQGILAFTIDGVTTNTVEGEAVPTAPMKLHIQTALVKRLDPPPAPTPTRLQVDWVRIYE